MPPTDPTNPISAVDWRSAVDSGCWDTGNQPQNTNQPQCPDTSLGWSDTGGWCDGWGPVAYAASDGARALIDRELYLPRAWTGDRDRCRAAGIGDDVPFATKPELAWQMIERAADAGVPFSWVTGDEVYGGNPKLRQRLEERQLPYVMAVACSEMAAAPAGCFRADELAALVPAGAWERLSCADGSKGPRLRDWALIGTGDPGHWLLARRSLRPGEKGQLELAFFRCWSPRPVTLPELAAVAGARWGIEDCFAEAKNETGLDHYQVRKYQAWYRHVTLSMLAHVFLAVTAHATRPETPHLPASGNDGGEPGKKGPAACGQIFAPRRTYNRSRSSQAKPVTC